VAFVTGGGTGIGRGIADAYIDAGAAVVVGGRRPGPLEDFCSRHGERAAMVRVDIGDDDARQRAIDFVIARFGRLDILVNNALAVYDRPFAEMTSKQIDITYRILLTAPTRLAQIALPHLIASESGCIINISSASARYTTHPITGLAVYSAAKAGINQLTRALASELGPLGVRVNAIAPGPTKVEAQDENTPSVNAATEATPLGRLGLPEDIAGVALFLASPAASWVTGQVIDATGGWGICG
jgi:NAD(P)-dependent dehydrogenase (short-subunit alcohol dehydrogenase family)